MKHPLQGSFNIVLGSKSPRRKELLSEMGLDFTVRINEIEEQIPDHIKPEQASEYLAKEKGKALFQSLQPNELIITADTLVILDKTVLGKPKNLEEAKKMLQNLSGKTHKVITGVNLLTAKAERSFSETTSVTFYVLNQKEIDFYAAHYETLDKAGSYGIQEWIGLIGVKEVRGCFYNVIGLPTPKLYQELKKFVN